MTGFTRRIGLVLLLALAMVSLAVEAQAQVRYVDIGLASSGSPGANNGIDWANAYHSLDAALNDSQVVTGLVPEIWVAKGTYHPDTTGLVDAREATFLIPNGVALLGGFVNGMDNLDSRYPGDFRRTVLSGDLAGAAQSYNVVIAQPGGDFVALDGFQIEAGFAMGSPGALPGHHSLNGAGLYARDTDLKLDHCFFVGNFADEAGGGLYFSGHPLEEKYLYIFECEFTTNVAALRGGGIYMEEYGGELDGDFASSHVYNTTFRRNFAGVFSGPGDAFANRQGGGAIAIGPRRDFAHAAFCNNLFLQNLTHGWGSAVWHTTSIGLAMSLHGQFTWSHCTFTSNVVMSGPEQVMANGSVQYFQTATYLADGHGTMSNSIFWDNPRHWLIQGLPDGVVGVPGFWTQEHCNIHTTIRGTLPAGQGNFRRFPLFVNAARMDYRLSSASPCLDNGSDALVPRDYPDGNGNGIWDEPVSYEFDKNRARSYDEVPGQTCRPTALPCGEADMGAFERQP